MYLVEKVITFTILVRKDMDLSKEGSINTSVPDPEEDDNTVYLEELPRDSLGLSFKERKKASKPKPPSKIASPYIEIEKTIREVVDDEDRENSSTLALLKRHNYVYFINDVLMWQYKVKNNSVKVTTSPISLDPHYIRTKLMRYADELLDKDFRVQCDVHDMTNTFMALIFKDFNIAPIKERKHLSEFDKEPRALRDLLLTIIKVYKDLDRRKSYTEKREIREVKRPTKEIGRELPNKEEMWKLEDHDVYYIPISPYVDAEVC